MLGSILKCLAAVPGTVMSPLCRLFRIAYLPFIEDYEGLGNRIKAIANVWTLGYRRIITAWRVEGWVNMPYDSLFRMENCKMYSFSRGGYKVLRLLFRRFLPYGIFNEYTPFWAFLLPKRFCREKYQHFWSFSSVLVHSIDYRFNEIDEDIREYYRPFFENLFPSEDVLRRIKMVDMPEDVVTVQVRNTNSRNDAKDVCSIDTIFKAMDEYPATQTFFISTMKQAVSSMFHARYGKRVFELPDKNPASLIDAVADMWLLGRGREMIASPCSTFSEVAWWWGGARIPVRHLKGEYNQARRECDRDGIQA